MRCSWDFPRKNSSLFVRDPHIQSAGADADPPTAPHYISSSGNNQLTAGRRRKAVTDGGFHSHGIVLVVNQWEYHGGFHSHGGIHGTHHPNFRLDFNEVDQKAIGVPHGTTRFP